METHVRPILERTAIVTTDNAETPDAMEVITEVSFHDFYFKSKQRTGMSVVMDHYWEIVYNL